MTEMKRAEYTIELHGRGGCYARVPFVGTRREARAEARRIKPKDGCTAIKFHRYVDSKTEAPAR